MVFEGHVNHILGTDYVGFDRFKRIVFADRYMFERGGVKYVINILEGKIQTVAIANVADKKTKVFRMAEFFHQLVFGLLRK